MLRFVSLAAAALSTLVLAVPALSDEASDAMHACDVLTSSPFDPGRRAEPPLTLGQIDVAAALAACTHALELSPGDARLHFQLGRVYEATSQFDLAWEFYSRAAGQDLAVSVRAIARMAYLGIGRPVDIDLALELYRKAADLGNVTAQWEYGISLKSDSVKDKDYALALKYELMAAEAGAVEGMLEVAHQYERAEGTPRDYAKAELWYVKCAELGYGLCMNDLGIFYGYATGRTPEYDKAKYWFEQAIEAGNSSAPQNLALIYENGRGVEIDLVKAAELYLLGKDRGNLEAAHNYALALYDGRGLEQDSVAAAIVFYQVIRAGIAFTVEMIVDDPGYWDAPFNTKLQELLAADGFYAGPINGELDEATAEAIQAALG